MQYNIPIYIVLPTLKRSNNNHLACMERETSVTAEVKELYHIQVPNTRYSIYASLAIHSQSICQQPRIITTTLPFVWCGDVHRYRVRRIYIAKTTLMHFIHNMSRTLLYKRQNAWKSPSQQKYGQFALLFFTSHK